MTGPRPRGMDIRDVIVAINPILRVGATTFAPGTPPRSSSRSTATSIDRLRGLMVKRYGRNLKPGQWQVWTREWFEAHGLYRLRGTNPLSGTRVVTIRKTIGKPCAGKPHARIERGTGKRA